MLKEFPKAGDSIIYLGGYESLTDELTIAHDYVVERVESEDAGMLKAVIIDDVGDEWEIYDAPDEHEMWELVEDTPMVGEATLITPEGKMSYRVEAKLANGATVTGFPSDVAAVIRNLEQAEYRAELREEKEFVPGDIVMWGIDLAEVVKASEGIHTEVKIGPNVFIAETENLTLVATAETRIDKEEF